MGLGQHRPPPIGETLDHVGLPQRAAAVHPAPDDARDLLGQLVKRDVLLRYRGAYFGVLWVFLNPLIMLAIFSFVFGQIFQARWPTQDASPRGATSATPSPWPTPTHASRVGTRSGCAR